MASLIDNLIDTLNKENEEYEMLFELSTEKTGIIVKGDLEALAQIVQREQEVVDRINALEKQRTEITKDIGIVLNRDTKDLTLPRLIELLARQERECSALKQIHDKLSGTMSRMVRVNESNKALLKESMEIIDFEMNLIKSMKQAPATANYSGASYADNSYASRVSFDAKQ